jgi:zinc protease
MLNRTHEPKIFSPVEFDYHLPDCNERKLSNGISLYYVTDNLQPVLQFEMVFKAGLWYESQTAIAQATASLLKSGTATRTSLEINEMFEQYGASVKAVAGSDWSSISISCLTKHLTKLLALLSELLTETIFPQSEIDIYIQNAKQRLSVQIKKSDFIANRKIDEFLFGIQHPYGKYLVADDYDNITQAALKNHLTQHYHSSNCTFFLAGHFGENELEAIETYFGKSVWNNATNMLIKEHEVVPHEQKKYHIENDAHGVQGSIRLASDFPTKFHPDFSPMIILNTLFGGYFGSRLMSNIREDKGYTYGIHSYMYNHQQASAYLITTEAGNEVCELAIQEIYKEMEILRNEKIDAEELLLVKNYLLGTILGDLDGSFQIIQRWKNLILNGFTKERFISNIEIYKTISAQQLQELANQYYQPQRFYELVVV